MHLWLAYLVLCLIVGYLGRNRAIGFWGFFILSLLVTPLIMAIVLAVAAPRSQTT
jgi:hypothetical protein